MESKYNTSFHTSKGYVFVCEGILMPAASLICGVLDDLWMFDQWDCYNEASLVGNLVVVRPIQYLCTHAIVFF